MIFPIGEQYYLLICIVLKSICLVNSDVRLPSVHTHRLICFIMLLSLLSIKLLSCDNIQNGKFKFVQQVQDIQRIWSTFCI